MATYQDTGGPDCAVENPMMRLARHFTQDKGLSEVRRQQHPAQQQIERGQPDAFGAALGHLQQRLGATHFDEQWVNEFQNTAQPVRHAPQHHPEFEDAYAAAERHARRSTEWGGEYRQFQPPATALDARQQRAFAESWREGVEESQPTDWAKNYMLSEPVADQQRVDDHGKDATAEEWASEYTGGKTKLEEWSEIFKKGLQESGWEEEFDQFQKTENAETFDAYNDAWGSAENTAENWASSFDTQNLADSVYQFEKDNPYLDGSTFDELFSKGKEALENGVLTPAILLLEAAVQLNKESFEAWKLLGLSQAENEQEEQAIVALLESLKLEERQHDAHLALAVSFTNESRYTEAYDALENALRNNPKYSSVVPAVKPPAASNSPNKRFMEQLEHRKRIETLYFKAAQQSPDNLDPDVQVGLGVLFNISGEYEKAAECFSAALQARPKDYLLWNKYGATLANNNNSAEAVEAYRTALELRPGYVRARYNIGISCINLNAYKEAAEHFLTALSLQQAHSESATQRNMSTTIWHSLRMAVSMDQKRDLLEATKMHDLEPFRKHYDF